MSVEEGVRFTIPGSLQPERKDNVPLKSFQPDGTVEKRWARVDSRSTKDWKARANFYAYQAMQEAGLPPYDEPVVMEVTWYMGPKPSGYRVADDVPFKRPDSKNLLSILEDAIDKVAFVDDARICDHVLHRRWGDARVEVEIRPFYPDYKYRRRQEEPGC